MTENDIKEETGEVENYDNYYNESDNYYIDKALGNIKDDPGTARSRPRRIPLYKIQLTDEEKIPPMPEKLLKEPKDEEFQKRIDDLKQQNQKKQESIKEYLEKIKQEKMGVKSDEKGNLFDRKKELNEQIKKINDEINAHEQSIIPIKTKFGTLSDKVKSFEKYHLPNHLNKLNAEIKKIKEKISFAPVSVNEEAELFNRKNLLEDYQKALKAFLDFKKENEEALNKTREPRKKRKELYEELNKIKKEIDKLKSQKDVVKPEIENMKKIVDSLKEDKKKISQQIREINEEWNNQWNEYNEQQNLIKYIKDAHARIKGLKKKEKKKQKEGEDKKDETVKGGLEITTVKKTDKDIRVQDLEDLKNYFQQLLPKEIKEQGEQELKLAIESSLSKEIQAGKLKKIEKIEFGIGVENVGKQKKKGKKPKEPKDSRKAAKKTGLVLDFQMIQKINECGLNPPTKMEDIPLFLKNLEKRQQGIQSGEISIEPPKKEEEPPKVEEKIVLKEVEEVKVVKEEKKVEPVQPKKKKEERKDIKKEEKKEEPKKEEKKEEKAVLPAQKVKSVEVKKEDEEEEDEEEEEEEDDEEEPKNANQGKPSNPAATQKTEIKKEEAGDKKAKKK